MLSVVARHSRARRFYEREVWELDGAERVDDLRGFPITEVRYRRAL